MTCDYLALAAPGVRTLQPYQPGKPDSEVRREFGLSEVVKLASNENPLGPSPRALAAVRDCLPELARYPDGNGFELKAALSAHLDIPPGWITLGNGSNDVLEIIARTFLTPSQASVFSEYAFAVYPLVTQASGATAHVARAHPPDHPQMPYGHDPAALIAAIDGDTRLLFIANPNNPTGTWLSADEMEALLGGVPENVLVVVDEAYVEYAEAGEYASVLPWVARFPNLIVTRTFSKAYGLAGLRVGYAVSHPEVAELLNRVRQPFNVNLPAQVAATAALSDHEHIERSRRLNRVEMARLQQAFNERGWPCLPSAGNFLCVRTPRPGRELFQALLRQGVTVRPVDNYGLPDFVRITVGSERENGVLLKALAVVAD